MRKSTAALFLTLALAATSCSVEASFDSDASSDEASPAVEAAPDDPQPTTPAGEPDDTDETAAQARENTSDNDATDNGGGTEAEDPREADVDESDSEPEDTPIETALVEGDPTEPDRTLDTSLDDDALLAAVNGGAPSGSGLSFEWRTLVPDDGYEVYAPVPVGWDESDFFGVTFDPSDRGFFTEVRYDTGCQGSCEPKDWLAEVMNDPELSPFAGMDNDESPATVLVRQELVEPPGRLMVLDSGPDGITAVRVTLVRWDDAADKYFRCTAELDEEDRDLWPAFADACLAARPLWIGS